MLETVYTIKTNGLEYLFHPGEKITGRDAGSTDSL
jgi:hypothetical protein